jgi:hypothetical protein
MVAFSQLGCAGPLALSLTREKYNTAVQKTTSEQLLLNLVRLRYRDPPSFMELSSLSTQFVFDQTVFANGQLDERSINQSILRLGAAAKIEQRPTVTYDMLQGQEFVRRLISPADVESIILLIRSGWSAERVLRMTVQQINGVENARTASGPTPEIAPDYQEFQSLVHTLRALQLSGEIRTGYETSERRLSGSIHGTSVQADDFIAAAKEGWRLQPRQDRVTINIGKIRSDSPKLEALI